MTRLRVRGAQELLQQEGPNSEEYPRSGRVDKSQNSSHYFCHAF